MALVHDYHSLVYELNRRYRIDGKCKLVTRGVSVNPAGVALAFPMLSDMHIPFSKAILTLTAQDKVTAILRSHCPLCLSVLCVMMLCISTAHVFAATHIIKMAHKKFYAETSFCSTNVPGFAQRTAWMSSRSIRMNVWLRM